MRIGIEESAVTGSMTDMGPIWVDDASKGSNRFNYNESRIT